MANVRRKRPKPSLIGSLFLYHQQQAVQEKFRQAGQSLDDLNAWLDKVERELAGQQAPSEDVDSLRAQIKGLKAVKDDVDEHSRPVSHTWDLIVELTETGADVLSSAELSQLQNEGKRLKERLNQKCLLK